MNLWNRLEDWILSPVWQIKKALEEEGAYEKIWWQKSLQDRTDAFRINQNNILMNILATARKYNKWKKSYLTNFVNKYISKLTIDQENELLSKLYYYLEVYEIEVPASKDTKKLKLDNEILIDTNNHRKSDIMSELLYNNVYLPEFENQKQFDEDMIKLIRKVENRITKFRLGRNPILFAPVSWWKILTYMDDVKSNIVMWVKYFDKWIIKNIWYKFALNERADSWEENEFYFSIYINWKDKNFFSRDEYIRHIMEDNWKWSLMDWRDYYFWEDHLFRYSYYIWEIFYKPGEWIDDDWLALDNEILWFEIRIYAHPKKDFNPEETLDNVCLRLPWVVENIVTDIYESYWRDKNGNTSYPSKTEYFNVANLLNSEEDKNGRINDLGEWLVNVTWWSEEENRKNVLHKWDMSNKEQTDLLIENQTYETINSFINQINNPEIYKKIWINKIPTWAIFYWPGWVWKSELCKKIWFETKDTTDFYYLNISELFNKFLWESEKNIDSIFIRLREEYKKTWMIQLLFIDEIDWLMSNESGEALSWIRSKLLSELSEWDNEWIILLATTNFPEKLNWPILRRFNEKVWVKLPDEKLRRELFNLFLSKYEQSLFDDDLDISKLVNQSAWMSHDFISQWVFNTVRYSATLLEEWEKIDFKFFMRFFERTKDSILGSEWKKMWFM